MPAEETKEQRAARLKAAEGLKEEGNTIFKEAMKSQSVDGYHQAKDKYVQAFHLLRQRLPQYRQDQQQMIEYGNLHSIVSSNLAQVSLKLGDYKAAESQTNAGLALCNPNSTQYEKLIYRNASALQG